MNQGNEVPNYKSKAHKFYHTFSKTHLSSLNYRQGKVARRGVGGGHYSFQGERTAFGAANHRLNRHYGKWR